ncbi:MAG: hypothetical protein ACT4O0_02530 [Pseudonocardia sp.]|jgi:hypothetical protein
MGDQRFEVRQPAGHVAIDCSGMLMGATGEAVTEVGDALTVYRDRESFNDFSELGRYDVTELISRPHGSTTGLGGAGSVLWSSVVD